MWEVFTFSSLVVVGFAISAAAVSALPAIGRAVEQVADVAIVTGAVMFVLGMSADLLTRRGMFAWDKHVADNPGPLSDMWALSPEVAREIARMCAVSSARVILGATGAAASSALMFWGGYLDTAFPMLAASALMLLAGYPRTEPWERVTVASATCDSTTMRECGADSL